MNIWWICCKAVILHPLSRGKRDEVEILKQREGKTDFRFEKQNFQKNLKKFW